MGAGLPRGERGERPAFPARAVWAPGPPGAPSGESFRLEPSYLWGIELPHWIIRLGLWVPLNEDRGAWLGPLSPALRVWCRRKRSIKAQAGGHPAVYPPGWDADSASIHSPGWACHPGHDNLNVLAKTSSLGIAGDLWGRLFHMDILKSCQIVLIKYSGSGGKLPRLETRGESIPPWSVSVTSLHTSLLA